jgi:hypothetical protein
MQGVPHLLLDPTSTEQQDAEYPRFDYDHWKRNHKSLADFPIQYYQQFFNPLSLENEAAVVGDAHDDLTDIYGELWHGLQALDCDDRIHAINHWRNSYFDHWGHHAASAIYAIDEFFRQHREIGEHMKD